MAITTLWNVSFSCPVMIADSLSDYLEEIALTVTTLAPPRHDTARIEALFDQQPDEEELFHRLCGVAQAEAQEKDNGGITDFAISVIDDLDWLKKVATDFPPLPIARWTIYGAAHKEAVLNEALPIQIDATSAFGTGEHPTTKGCLILLDRYLQQATPSSMLDIGCGSGILAMCFAKATGGKAVGVDLDPESVQIARENVQVNNLSDLVRIDLSEGYAAPIVAQNAPYDLIMSNIFADPLCELAHDLKKHCARGGYAILSGILNHQAEKVIAAHTQQGLTLDHHLQLGEWSILALRAD